MEREVRVVVAADAEGTGKRRMMRRRIAVGGMVERRGKRRQPQRGVGEIEAEMSLHPQWVACLNLRVVLYHRWGDRS